MPLEEKKGWDPDFTKRKTGVVSIAVRNPGETQLVIETLVACLGTVDPV